MEKAMLNKRWLLCLLALALALPMGVVVTGSSNDDGDKDGGHANNDEGNDGDDEMWFGPDCGIYYAKSTIPGAGYGIFAGKHFNVDDWVIPGDLVVPLVEMAWNNGHADDYVHLCKFFFECTQERIVGACLTCRDDTFLFHCRGRLSVVSQEVRGDELVCACSFYLTRNSRSHPNEIPQSALPVPPCTALMVWIVKVKARLVLPLVLVRCPTVLLPLLTWKKPTRSWIGPVYIAAKIRALVLLHPITTASPMLTMRLK